MTLAFFRRHRGLFMVLMVLGVVGFVVFGTWRQMTEKLNMLFGSTGPRLVIGTIGGRKIRAGEMGEFYRKIRAAGRASRYWAITLGPKAETPDAQQRLYFYTMGMTALPVMTGSTPAEELSTLQVMAWMAQYEEARRWGFGTTQAEVDVRLQALRDLGLTAAEFQRVVDEVAGGERSRFYQALRADMTLRAYVNWLAESVGVAVDPELRKEFARIDERIKVRLVVFKPEDFLDQVNDVGEEVVLRQFRRYKQYLPGQGPGGHGYRIPDRVALEYLVLDPAVFEEAAAEDVSEEDVKAYYESHKDPDFLVAQDEPTEEEKDAASRQKAPGESPETGEQAGDDAGGTAEAAETEEPEKEFRPFEEVREEIVRILARRKAEQQALERMESDVAEIRTSRTARDLRIWADQTQVRYAAVAGLKTAGELAAVEGLGRAARGPERLPEYAVALVELVGPGKGRLAKMEISEVFTDPEGRLYAFRVTEFQENHEPATVDEVRDEVVADVRAGAAFDVARERGRSLVAAASEKKGLEAAAKAAGVELVESEWFPREYVLPYGQRWLKVPPTLPGVGADPVLVAECFRLASEGKERTLVTLARSRAVVVAELAGHRLPREAAYRLMRPLLAGQVAARLAEAVLEQVLDPDAMCRRFSVVEVTEIPEPKEAPEDRPEPQG